MKLTSLFVSAALAASAQTVAIINARIFPISSTPIDKGTVLIQDGRITGVGVKIAVPAGARKIDGAGLSVYPGWIDGLTSVGLVEVAGVRSTVDTTEVGPFNPAAQAWIAVNPHSEMIRTARVNGITTALVAPSGGIVAGVASAMNLLGNYPDHMAVLKNAGVVLNIPSMYEPSYDPGGGPAPPGVTDPVEARRRRVAEQVEKLKGFLREAKRYADMKARSGENPPASAVDSGLEAMVPVMRGERPAICVADHFRDIRAAVNLGDEFGMKILIAGGADAWKVAELLKEKHVGVLYSAVHELPRSAEDPYDTTFTTPEALRRAGVPFAIVSGSSSDVRTLPYRASMAAAYGLEREDALKSITLWPAQLLGIADKVGSIEQGKLANLLVTKGDPLDIRSEVKYVFVEGKEVPADTRNVEMYERFKGQ